MGDRVITTLDGRLPTVTLVLQQNDTITVRSNVQNPDLVREIIARGGYYMPHEREMQRPGEAG